MNNDSLKTLVAQGLQALRAGSEVAKRATSEIQNDAQNEELRNALRQGEQQSQQWDQRIQRAQEEAGSAQDEGNPVLEAHYEVSRRIRATAPDAMSRDLGIIASGQLALHYWIASFGTLRTYASQMGMTQAESDLQACLDEAKQADLQHTEIAERIMRSGG